MTELIKNLVNQINKLKNENKNLLKQIQDYKDIIKEYKKNIYKVPDESDGEATSFYDSD